MEVDPPASLKRSNSAPMINELNSNMAAAAGATSTSAAAVRESSAMSLMQPRTRRFSGSSFTSHSAGSSPRPSPRVSQLRQEECLDMARSEAAHEKEIHSAIQMSQSCEDLTLVTESLSCSDNESERRVLGPRMDPLHLNLPPHSPVCSSPSPTRSGFNRQLFASGGMYSGMSSSPTRKSYTTRRSQSPIAVRPSTLGPAVKRKFELDEAEQYRSPPTKRLSTGNGSGLLIAQHRLEQGSSPLPGSLSSVGTPDSMSSADSPNNFTFRPLDSPSPGRAHTGPSEHSPS